MNQSKWKKALSLTLAAAMIPVFTQVNPVKSYAAEIPADTVTLADMVVASSVYGWITTAAKANDDNSVTVGIVEAGSGEESFYTTALKYGGNNDMTISSNDGANVIVTRCKAGVFAEVCLNAEGQVIDIRRVVNAGLSFDTAEFGGDLTKIGSEITHKGLDYVDIYNNNASGTSGSWTGESGSMVASGWIYGKTADGEITVGDGNMTAEVFNETYQLADDAKIYLVDTKSYASTEISYSELPVTPLDENGYIYNTSAEDRKQVIVIFDGDYSEYGQAKVKEIYCYSTNRTDNNVGKNVSKFVGCIPQSVRIGSDLSEQTQGSPSPNAAPYLVGAIPTTVVEGKMWTIGDIEDNCPVFKGGSDASMGKEGDGTWLTQFDTGWENDGYQYFSNIAKVGLDPRDIDQILIPHGHGDHYGTAYDEWEMIVRGGGSSIVYESYEDTNGYDIYGYDEIAGIYSDPPVRSIITNWYSNDVWMELGEGLSMQVTLSPGNTQGTGSAIFQVKVGEGVVVKDSKLNYEINEESGEYERSYSDYVEGNQIMFAYMGGYVINGLANVSGTTGFRRLYHHLFLMRY